MRCWNSSYLCCNWSIGAANLLRTNREVLVKPRDLCETSHYMLTA